MNPKLDQSLVGRIAGPLTLPRTPTSAKPWPTATTGELPSQWWPTSRREDYFNQTIALTGNRQFLDLVGQKQFHPVRDFVGEDIGRYKNSVWGDRISDVGIWVRKDERQPIRPSYYVGPPGQQFS
ncbi:MAG: hypothetical protein R2857_02405 [Vampirovibrionales bacterium]